MKKNLKKVSFRPDFYFETAKDFCFHLGIDQYDIANLTGTHPKTAKKWIDTNKPPVWLLPFLYAVTGGVISSKEFYGWKLDKGVVIAPGNRYPLTASQIESYCWHLDAMRQSQARIAQIELQALKTETIQTAILPPNVLAFPKR